MKLVVIDADRTFDPVKTVKLGQALDIGVDTFGDPEVAYAFSNSGRVCIIGSPNTCRSVSGIYTYEGSGRVGWWRVRVQPHMIANNRFAVEVTFNNETLAQRSYAVVAAPKGPPKVQWGKGAGLESIPICFAEIPEGFSAGLRVKHWWRGHPKADTRTFRFAFKPARGFRTAKYRGVPHYVSVFDEYCLDIVPRIAARGSRVGFFVFTYIYGNRTVSSASYKYSIESTPTHLAKEGSDEFFNYCVKRHPEKIFQSGGVLMCEVPGGIEVLYVRR